MGYTHYIRRREILDKDKFSSFIKECKEIIKNEEDENNLILNIGNYIK